MCFRELKPLHRLLMRIGQKVGKNPEAKAKALLDFDDANRASIAPILARIRSFEQTSSERS